MGVTRVPRALPLGVVLLDELFELGHLLLHLSLPSLELALPLLARLDPRLVLLLRTATNERDESLRLTKVSIGSLSLTFMKSSASSTSCISFFFLRSKVDLRRSLAVERAKNQATHSNRLGASACDALRARANAAPRTPKNLSKRLDGESLATPLRSPPAFRRSRDTKTTPQRESIRRRPRDCEI